MKEMLTSLLFLCVTTAFAVSGNDPFQGVNKILVIGNSLSRHHLKPSIGWTTYWGMAASDKQKDYLHVMLNSLKKMYPDTQYDLKIVRLGNENKMTGVESVIKHNYKADLILFQHGENFRGKINDEELRKPYEEVIISLKKNITPNIICIGRWSLNPKGASKSAALMKKAAENQDVIFIDICDIGKVENSAWKDPRFAKCANGVKWHPSDKGMKLIAERILKLSPKYHPGIIPESQNHK